MEGARETAEEKEEEEEEKEEEEKHRSLMAAASSVEYQDLPIMHWEDLSQRIAELEKQEQERRERSKRGAGQRMEEGGVWRDVWKEEEEEEEDLRRRRAAVVTSRDTRPSCLMSVCRFHNHRNLQLCFINDSDSEDEEDASNRKVTGTGHEGCHAAGLKQEVATALRTLRDQLLAEQKEKEKLDGSSSAAKRKHLEHWELKECSVQQLSSLGSSLQQEVHALSSELVAHLLVRDQLRTKQDAMLLDVQDLT